MAKLGELLKTTFTQWIFGIEWLQVGYSVWSFVKLKVQIKAVQQQLVILENLGVALHSRTGRFKLQFLFCKLHTQLTLCVPPPENRLPDENYWLPGLYCNGEFYHKVLPENFKLFTELNVMF